MPKLMSEVLQKESMKKKLTGKSIKIGDLVDNEKDKESNHSKDEPEAN